MLTLALYAQSIRHKAVRLFNSRTQNVNEAKGQGTTDQRSYRSGKTGNSLGIWVVRERL